MRAPRSLLLLSGAVALIICAAWLWRDASAQTAAGTARIWGRVWEDANGNGMKESAEKYIRDDLSVCDTLGTVSLEVVIGGSGPLPFSLKPSRCSAGATPFPYFDTGPILPAGDYHLKASVPEGWELTTVHADKAIKISAGKYLFEWIGIRKISPPPVARNDVVTPFADQLMYVDWNYRKIFDPADIPVPPSVQNAPQARVLSIYSPSVVRFQEKYVMLFGVAVYCNPEGGPNVAKDSIALAESPDGNIWQFKKYILEGDTNACSRKAVSWPPGMIFQANDPFLFLQSPTVDPEQKILNVLFTAGEWQPEKNTSTATACGNIGIAKFDRDYRLLYRNDRFLNGISSCSGGKSGYSRPSLQWTSGGATRLWFDVSGEIFSTPVLSTQQLTSPVLTNEGIRGGDVDTPRLTANNYAEGLIFPNGGNSGIIARSRRSSTKPWSPLWGITAPSAVRGDPYQSSPSFYLNAVACQPRIYYAGGPLVTGEPGNPYTYFRYGLFVATPPISESFSFPACSNYSGAPVYLTRVSPSGRDITVNFSYSRGTARNWIALYRAGEVDNAQWVDFRYLNNAKTPPSSAVAKGVVVFSGLEPGAYEVRYLLDRGIKWGNIAIDARTFTIPSAYASLASEISSGALWGGISVFRPIHSLLASLAEQLMYLAQTR